MYIFDLNININATFSNTPLARGILFNFGTGCSTDLHLLSSMPSKFALFKVKESKIQ